MAGAASLTIPLTITITIGTPVITHEPTFYVGHNQDYGWSGWCRCCRTTRWLSLYISPSPYFVRDAYCNVCCSYVPVPTEGSGVQKTPRHIGREVLHRQRLNPHEYDPPPVDYDAAR